MKNKLIKSFLIALVSILVTAGIVGAADLLPRISKVCETASGQLTAIEDGYSTVANCPKNSRLAYMIGDQGPQGVQGDQGPIGPERPVGTDGKFSISQVYTKVDGPFNVTANVPNTISHGCYQGDLAIGGGIFSYSGSLNNWVTVKSTPRYTEPSDLQYTIGGMDTTVLNIVENGTITLMTRCLDLTP